MSLLLPPTLTPGSIVRIVAPASPLPSRSLFWAGVAWLKMRYQVRISADVFERAGYLAGTDAIRRSALQSALDEPDTDAIVLARGGYGITRLLESLDFTGFVATPKWLVGFSDGTALLHALAARGLGALHASNVTGLAALGPSDRAAWLAALEGTPMPSWRWRSSDAPSVVDVSGQAFGGNLSLLQALAAAGELAPPQDAVWFVEDVTERPYRLDRMAISLRPWVKRARAIVLGEFAGCAPAADGVTAADALRAAWGDLGVPLLFGAPFGHGVRNAPFVHGAEVGVRLNAAGDVHVRWS